MGFKGNKSIVYTKNKFEAYLNSLNTRDEIHTVIGTNSGYIDGISGYSDNKFGSNFRRKDKLEFNRQYLIWLNTK